MSAVLAPNDPLTLAHARMRAAALVVLREAAEAHERGEDVGVWRDVLRQYAPLLPLLQEDAA